jgi:hypothetical protein
MGADGYDSGQTNEGTGHGRWALGDVRCRKRASGVKSHGGSEKQGNQ